MTKPVIYEHPLNERVRILLRLEHLFAQAGYFLQGAGAWESRAFLTTLSEILDVFGRSDLKTELIKEVERATGNLDPLLQNPDVDTDRLRSILRALERLGGNLHGIGGQLGQELREDEFITPIRQRMTIPGGTCDFDLPGYHFWLEQPAELRHTDQERWYASLDPVRQTVELLLKLMRNSAEPRPRVAKAGVYQQTLESGIPFQLLRIMIPADAAWFAEVSGNRHRFTIRLRKPGESRTAQIDEDIEFRLSCCSL